MGTARALQAQGGPPPETDDPGTPGSGHVELNISVEAERESAGTSYDVPRLDANLGLEHACSSSSRWRVATAPAEPARTGIGNVVLGVKWRFAQTGAVAVSTYPQLTLGGSESAGMKGVADRETTLLMPVEVAWNVGPVSLNAEVGYQRGQGSSELVCGLALAREAGRALELLGECHGSGNTDLTEQGVLCGVGFRWVLQHTVGLLVAYATGVIGSAEDRPDHRLYSGVQLRW